MRTSALLIAAATVACLGACSSDSGSTGGGGTSSAGTRAMSSGQSAKVDKAATIARAIRSNPQSADDVLRQNGMTEEQYESLMYEIAADPAMSAEFNARVGP
jgi:hypothetical protein